MGKTGETVLQVLIFFSFTQNYSAARCKIKSCNRPHHRLLHALSENRKSNTVNFTNNTTWNSKQTLIND